ncbi:MAG TPA: hypothetical protein VG297_04690 [Bryobacteraceae bacterium]|jgi:hypothetical protein|nr:hypothetical protein [Bryobacteraceae bacterium]
MAALFAFDETAGAVSAVPAQWPSASVITRPGGNGALLVFVHPYCSCTVATIHEIATLSAGRNSQNGRPATTVLFYRPRNAGWRPGSLWSKVNEIPGARAVWDDDGREARRFGARTSGYTLLYGARGDLLFKGGVTGSRGHEGGNLGIDQLRTSIDTGRPAPRGTLVFGCALADAGEPPAAEEREEREKR